MLPERSSDAFCPLSEVLSHRSIGCCWNLRNRYAHTASPRNLLLVDFLRGITYYAFINSLLSLLSKGFCSPCEKNCHFIAGIRCFADKPSISRCFSRLYISDYQTTYTSFAFELFMGIS